MSTAVQVRSVALPLIAALIVAGGVAVAQTNPPTRPSLCVVMQELHAECLRAGSALMSDDFASLQEAANAISGHPMPDEVVAAIKSKLGRDLRAFEALDDASHKAARNLSARAAVKDSVGASKAYNNLTATCVGCHKQFRATLKPLSD